MTFRLYHPGKRWWMSTRDLPTPYEAAAMRFARYGGADRYRKAKLRTFGGGWLIVDDAGNEVAAPRKAS